MSASPDSFRHQLGRTQAMKRLKALLKSMLGEPALGALDYVRHPELRDLWGGPFNGQLARAALFRSLVAQLKPQAIIETGTYHGTTTEFMAQTGLPLFTVENHPRNYGFSRARLLRCRRVTVHRGDSRQFLRHLFQGPLRAFADRTLFAYLDAHGENDLPLADEIDLIFGHCRAAVIMIDDFQVPDDKAYRYDDYGGADALTPAYIEPSIRTHDLQAYYPSVPAAQETGMRRGCVVLAKQAVHAVALASISELRKAT